jgi:tetratricopeptide (TPR) repeat protein
MRERLGDKASMGSLLSNLGVIAEYRGDYAASKSFHEKALALRTEIGDRWAIGVSANSLGMIAVLERRFDEARQWFEKAMQLCREVGDGWMVALCHNNLGNALRGLCEYAAAAAHYGQSIRAYRRYDDRWALAFVFEDVGIHAALEGDSRLALALVGAADACRDVIGTPRAPSLEKEINHDLEAAISGMPESEQRQCRALGHGLDPDVALERALVHCERAASDGRG